MRIEAADYIEAAHERLSNAKLLYEAAQYSFALYAAGVAVESLLRGYIGQLDPILEAGHNLLLLLRASNLRNLITSNEMETLMKRVQKILQKEFPRREIRLKAAGKGKLDGFIISKSFEKLTVKERQRKVWGLLETDLSEKDRNRVLGFFTLTPVDEKWIFDGSSYDKFEASLKKKRPP